MISPRAPPGSVTVPETAHSAQREHEQEAAKGRLEVDTDAIRRQRAEIEPAPLRHGMNSLQPEANLDNECSRLLCIYQANSAATVAK